MRVIIKSTEKRLGDTLVLLKWKSTKKKVPQYWIFQHCITLIFDALYIRCLKKTWSFKVIWTLFAANVSTCSYAFQQLLCFKYNLKLNVLFSLWLICLYCEHFKKKQNTFYFNFYTRHSQFFFFFYISKLTFRGCKSTEFFNTALHWFLTHYIFDA